MLSVGSALYIGITSLEIITKVTRCVYINKNGTFVVTPSRYGGVQNLLSVNFTDFTFNIYYIWFSKGKILLTLQILNFGKGLSSSVSLC